jgi:uncharacterized membrane protein YhaH (DUF805 family)
MSGFVTALKKYAVFSGRSRRSEYWYFSLFYLIFYLGLAVVDGVLGTFDTKSGFGLCSAVWAVAMVIPSLAVSIRRLHDTGRSGWWLLIGVIPLLGAIALIVFFAQDGEPGTNRFGSNPKEGSTGHTVAAAAPGKSWAASTGKR